MGKGQLIIFIIAATTSTLALFAGVLYLVMMYRKRQLENKQTLNKLQEEFAQVLMQHTIATQQETMQQIGREIHDNVGQKLTLASLYVQQQLLSNQHHPNRLDDIGTFIDQSLHDLRQLSKTLSLESAANTSFVAMLVAACEAVNRLGRCTVVYTLKNIEYLHDPATRHVLLRVLQEFLQNSVRHAQCTQIQVECHIAEEQLTLHLQDNGKGFDLSAVSGNGAGLSNIHARVVQIGGKVIFNTAPGKGTSLTVILQNVVTS